MRTEHRSAVRKRAVVVGAGRMGTHHARVARAIGMETFTVDPHRPADFKAYEDAPRADVVAVATPIGELARCAIAALDAGCRRLLVEKPLAASLEDAEAVVDRAAAAGGTLVVGYTDRFDPLVELVRSELLAHLGTIHGLRFERRGPRPPAARPSIAPGVDLAVHDIDLLRHLGFRPALVEGSASADEFAARLECDGAEATVYAAYEPDARVRRFTVDGDAGTLKCDLVGRRVSVITGDGVTEHSTTGDEPLLGQWLALLNGGGGPNGRDALEALTLVLSVTGASAPRADRAGPGPRPAPGSP